MRRRPRPIRGLSRQEKKNYKIKSCALVGTPYTCLNCASETQETKFRQHCFEMLKFTHFLLGQNIKYSKHRSLYSTRRFVTNGQILNNPQNMTGQARSAISSVYCSHSKAMSLLQLSRCCNLTATKV